MSRTLARILIGVGAFLIVLAPLSKWYVYPRIAVAPANQDSVTTLVGPNATIFDTSTLTNVKTTLTTKVHTQGDISASKQAPGNTVVWMNNTSTKGSDGTLLSASIDRVAFNANTGESVNCCGAYTSTVQGTQTPITFTGLYYKFPFDTQKKTYEFWDGSLDKSTPASYAGTETVAGLTTYKFNQQIPETKIGTVDAPRSVLGLSGSGNVKADSMYAVDRTLWIEPQTGVIIKRVEHQHSSLYYQGTEKLVTTDVTTGYNQATIQANADTYGPKATQLKLVGSWLPLLGLILGLILLGAGLALRPWRSAA